MNLFKTLFTTDFILKNWKAISITITSLMILCLLCIFIVQAHSNIKNPTPTTPSNAKTNTLDDNLTNKFSFENLQFKTSNINDPSSSFMENTDQLLGSYQSDLLFQNGQKGLYFYNLNNGKEDNVVDSSIFSQISNNELFYVKKLDEFSNDLMRYNIETKKTDEITNIDTTQPISGIAGSGDVVYYILNDQGKNYLTAFATTTEAGKLMTNFYIALPSNSYLLQEGEKVYLVNQNGQFLINTNKLEKVADTPKMDYTKVQIWNGKALVYGNDELYYQNKVIYKSHNLLEMNPIDSTHLLINDHNNLLILNINSLKTKPIFKQVNSSVVSNGSLIFSTTDKTAQDPATNAYFYFKSER